MVDANRLWEADAKRSRPSTVVCYEVIELISVKGIGFAVAGAGWRLRRAVPDLECQFGDDPGAG